MNWFRKNDDGGFLWPGFGHNSRVLAWVLERIEGRAEAVETPIGWVPAPRAIDTRGLAIDEERMSELLRVDPAAWRAEIPLVEDHYALIGERLPSELRDELRELEKRLG